MGRMTCTHLNLRDWRRGIAPRGIVVGLLWAGLSTHAVSATPAALPAADLIVQVRVISHAELAEEAAASSSPERSPQRLEISSAAQPAVSARTQDIRVLNGHTAEMSWSQALPFQWVQAAQRRGRAGNVPSGGIVNAVTWLRAGQSLSVQPRWPGGRYPVQVELRVETQDIGDRRGADIPESGAQTWASTLSVPWGQWTTFATTGAEQPSPDGATWSTQSAQPQGLRFMQLRVTRH
jgi:hypothetical protein